MAIQKFIVNGDEAKIDYEGLENKPFGEEEGTIIAEVTKSFNEPSYPGASSYMPDTEETILSPFEEGATYTITFDNVEYERVCQVMDMGGMLVYYIGNLELIGYPTGTGEPFLFQYDSSACYAKASTIGEHTYEVSGMIISTLDPKYLPEYLQYGRETVQTITDEDYVIEDGEIH